MKKNVLGVFSKRTNDMFMSCKKISACHIFTADSHIKHLKTVPKFSSFSYGFLLYSIAVELFSFSVYQTSAQFF